MATLVELASQIVTAQATTSPMSTEDVLNALSSIHARLKQLESGTIPAPESIEEAKVQAPALTVKDAFKKNEIVCMECGKGGFKTLTRHLSKTHNMKPGEYRKKFGIPSKQSLSAKNYSETRRQMAISRGLGDNLAKARQVRKANLEAQAGAVPLKKGRSPKAPGKAAKAPKAAATA